MLQQIGPMLRGAILGVGLLLLGAAPMAALSSGSSVDGAERAIQRQQEQSGQRPSAPIPEPGAVLVFALGAGAVAWGVRRRRSAS